MPHETYEDISRRNWGWPDGYSVLGDDKHFRVVQLGALLRIAEALEKWPTNAHVLIAKAISEWRPPVPWSQARIARCEYLRAEEEAHIENHNRAVAASHGVEVDFTLTPDMDACVLDVPVRVVNVLRDLGVKTIADVLRCTARRLREERNFGDISLMALRKELAKHGWKLAGD